MADSSTSKNSIVFTTGKNLSELIKPGNRISVLINNTLNTLIPDNLKKYFTDDNVNAVLTLLKKGNDQSSDIYSLSIDFKDSNIDIPENIDDTHFKNYWYNMHNKNLVKYDDLLNNEKTKYILIIGKLIKPDAADPDAADPDEKSSLEIKKIIFIFDSSSSPQNLVIANVDLSKEEFLNLYYIDYFSFDDGKFTEKYTQFINPPALKPGGSTLVKKKKKAK